MLITQLTDTKGLECAHVGEIILQQKRKNTNNSLVRTSVYVYDLGKIAFSDALHWFVLHKLDCFRILFFVL